ncbi:HesB/YadR/YfhF family protein [Paenibacillus sp. NPDC056722]|uniref:HesB/YadR/YfhF family protein n=1 Tax=Paenibacillus sp. NPDC056722 TaxID=3345924 RepID=UPI0036C4AD9A
MKLTVTKAAVRCFTTEWDFQQGDFIRIFVRYSGGGEDAFAFGIMKADPQEMSISYESGGITFFMVDNDTWYLDGKELAIDSINDEITFIRN